MTPPSAPVLTVAQMRAAEQALIDGGETVESLMERAGTGVADWVYRLAAARPVTVLCGPGNNGGDGYVIARELGRRGLEVTVVAPMEPATPAARAAREAWGGAVQAQGRGGSMIFVTIKNAVAAGKGASAYSAAKAAELHLARCLTITHHRPFDGAGVEQGKRCLTRHKWAVAEVF